MQLELRSCVRHRQRTYCFFVFLSLWSHKKRSIRREPDSFSGRGVRAESQATLLLHPGGGGGSEARLSKLFSAERWGQSFVVRGLRAGDALTCFF